MKNLFRIEEETDVEFEKYTDLSYFDEFGDVDVVLCVDKKPIGKIKVWKDRGQEGREYIFVNYKILYLDTLEKLDNIQN
jgi:hypothetical protein